jgi:hypothetical protein
MKGQQYVQGLLFNEAEKRNEDGFAQPHPQYEERIKNLQKVIRRLREDSLHSGHCFMIFDEHLEEDEALYEYPDGRIRIERLDRSNIEVPRQIIRVLTGAETKAIKSKHAIFR